MFSYTASCLQIQLSASNRSKIIKSKFCFCLIVIFKIIKNKKKGSELEDISLTTTSIIGDLKHINDVILKHYPNNDFIYTKSELLEPIIKMNVLPLNYEFT